MSKALFQKRHQSRFFLIQALYQWALSSDSPEAILQQFEENPAFNTADQAYFTESFLRITASSDTLDECYQVFLDRRLAEIDPIEKSILRLACDELLHRPDLPYRVIINEALELAKMFGATDSHKYINGVLDKVMRKTRLVGRTS